MRDSLNAGPLSRRGERSSRQKRPTPSEMPIAPGKKKDRGRARVASSPGQQRRSDPDDRASSSSRKRPRLLAQMGGGSSRLQRPDPSISPPPTRKRGRPTNEERLRREKDCERSASQGRGQRSLSVGAARSSLPRSNASETSDRTVVESLPSRPAAAPAASATSAAASSVPAATATSGVSSSSPSWPFQQQPQRLTRTRPVDQDRMMKVFIGEGPSKGPRSGSGSSGGGGSSSSSSSNTSTSDLGEAVQTLEAFAQPSGGSSRNSTQGVATSASTRGGGARHGSSSTAGASRRHGGRCGAAGARARGTSASPGRRGSAASTATAPAAAPPAATSVATGAAGAIGGGSAAKAKAGAIGSSDHVIVPKFRLHNLFSDSTAPGGGEAPEDGRMRTPGTGSRRKRPAGKAAAASGAESIAPPQPPRGGREAGFLELTKDSLVRSSHTAVFGSDYDLDDEDCAFLEMLNASVSSGSSGGGGGGSGGEGGGTGSTNRPIRNRSARNQGTAGGEGGSLEEKGWPISEELFEAMIEKLERQESRARDTMVLVEASLRLKQEHDEAAERVNQFIREGDAVLNAALGNVSVSEDSGAGGALAGGSSGGFGDGIGVIGRDGGCGGGVGGFFGGGNNTQGICDGGASSSNARKRVGGCGSSSGDGAAAARRRQNGYAQEDDSDSDEGEHQARILRSRGPAILSQPFALPLLRSCVVASLERAGSGGGGLGGGAEGGVGEKSRGTVAPKAARSGKGKGKAAVRAGVAAGGVLDEKLVEVFQYWAKKRRAYGGPMLRCFHPFMMKLWRRMEDPVREAEDQEEGRDPHASPEAFDTLKSFRQDLDRARLVVDCVKRREKLKRSAVRFANAYWTILDDTMDAPRPSRPYSQARPPAPPQARQATPTATAAAVAAATAAAEEVAAAAVVAASAAGGRPSTRMVSRAGVRNGQGVGDGGGGCRSSGRAAAAAARAAVSAIATAEALEDEEEFDRGAGGGGGRVEGEREGEGSAGGDGRGPEEAEQGVRGGRVNGSGRPKGGCAEQEHGWDMFAQLPALPRRSAGDVDQQERQRLAERWEERWRVDCGARTAEGNRGLFVHHGREEEEVEKIVDAGIRARNWREVGAAERMPWTHRIRQEMENIPTQQQQQQQQQQQRQQQQEKQRQQQQDQQRQQQQDQQRQQQQGQQRQQKQDQQQQQPASGRGGRPARASRPTPPPSLAPPPPPPPSTTTTKKAEIVSKEADARTKRRNRFHAASCAAAPLPSLPPRRRTNGRERFRQRSSLRILQSASSSSASSSIVLRESSSSWEEEDDDEEVEEEEEEEDEEEVKEEEEEEEDEEEVEEEDEEDEEEKEEEAEEGEEEDKVKELLPTASGLSTRRRISGGGGAPERRSVRTSRLGASPAAAAAAPATTLRAEIEPKPEPEAEPKQEPESNRNTKRQRITRAMQPHLSPPLPPSEKVPPSLGRMKRRSSEPSRLGPTNKPGVKFVKMVEPSSSPTSSIAKRCKNRASRSDASPAPK